MADNDEDRDAPPVRIPGPRGPERTEQIGESSSAGGGRSSGGGAGGGGAGGGGRGADWRDAARAVEADENKDEQITQAVAKTAEQLLDDPAPVVTTHSHGVEALLAAQEISLKGIVADLDAKIALLNAERTDAMLAYSMLNAGRAAKDRA